MSRCSDAALIMSDWWTAESRHYLELGLVVDERTVSRYRPRDSTSPDQLRRWVVFLRNHRDSLVGMDFFTVPTVTFRRLWVFVVRHHERGRGPLRSRWGLTILIIQRL